MQPRSPASEGGARLLEERDLFVGRRPTQELVPVREPTEASDDVTVPNGEVDVVQHPLLGRFGHAFGE
jgi:hypothetical protein